MSQMSERRQEMYDAQKRVYLHDVRRFEEDTELMISATPTGPKRELLTELNILLGRVRNEL